MVYAIRISVAYNDYRGCLSRGKAAEARRLPPTPSSAEAKKE